MIRQAELLALLNHAEPWNWRATDWRKIANGKIVRFINWNWKRRGY